MRQLFRAEVKRRIGWMVRSLLQRKVILQHQPPAEETDWIGTQEVVSRPIRPSGTLRTHLDLLSLSFAANDRAAVRPIFPY